MKKCLVCRMGAFGDAIFVTPLLKKLKEDGYHVTVYVSKWTDMVLKNNPNIDKAIVQLNDMTFKELKEKLETMKPDYDKFIDLSGSIEASLLLEEGTPEFNLPKDVVDKTCNVNYQDRTMEIGGYPEVKGCKGELFFSQFEVSEARKFRQKYEDYFLILWALSGSSFHKAYPYTEHIEKALLRKYQNIMFLNVGDTFCEILDIPHESRIKNYSGKWSIRKTMLMTKYVNLVIGCETGVLNAASCYDTNKVIMLSHSSEENLTKYWTNTTVLTANVPCQPCHKLVKTLEACPHNEFLMSPICMSEIKPLDVFCAIEKSYLKRFEEDLIWQPQQSRL